MASIKYFLLTLISLLMLFAGPFPCKVSAEKSLTNGSNNYRSIAIVGLVYCKSCKLWGYVNSMNASPVSGGVVRVTCYYTSRRQVTVETKTGASGYFYMKWPDVVNFSLKKCWAYLGDSPYPFCNVPLYPNLSNGGARLKLAEVRRGNQAIFTPNVLMYGPKSRSNKICYP